MKLILPLILLIFMLFSCSMEKKQGTFTILPTPQEISISGTSEIQPQDIKSYFSQSLDNVPNVVSFSEKNIDLKNTSLQVEIDEKLDLKPEGYQLSINANSIMITGKDKAGAFYGMMTLAQLIEDANEQGVNLPLLEVKDYPLLAYRSIHLDVKHHRETTAYYYELMDRLAKFKINGVIAEVEDKLGYKRQPIVASEDALSIEEWKKLSDYAMERNIKISPLIQGLGHASFVLKHEDYKHLRDDPKSDWAFNPLDPETYEVQFDLYLDAIDAFPHAEYLHIGGDEVHTTGRGSGQSALELQLYWLDKVCKFAEEHDKTPIFWDDMPLKHANVYGPMFNRDISDEKVDSIWEKNEHKLVEFIDEFPENCVYMRWNYQSPETYGNIKAMDWFSSNGFQVMGATAGQTRWSLMPQNQSNIPNIKSFALSSIDKELDGLFLTLWDDDSPHFELYIRGIMAFAEYTWAGGKKSIEEFKQQYRQRAFGSEMLAEDNEFIDMLEGPVGIWKNALLQKGRSRNNLRKFENPLVEASLELPDPSSKGIWSDQHSDRLKMAKEQLLKLDTVQQRIDIARSKAIRNEYTLDMYEQVGKLTAFSYNSLVALENYDRSAGDTQAEALEKVKNLAGEFSSLRKELEDVYGKARILKKPAKYILDQDHHTHNANQSLNFDWQFYPEMLLIEKIEAL